MLMMQPKTLPVSSSSAFCRPRSSSPVDIENIAEDLSNKKPMARTPSPSPSDRLSPVSGDNNNTCQGRISFPENSPVTSSTGPNMKIPLRFGVDSIMSQPHSVNHNEAHSFHPTSHKLTLNTSHSPRDSDLNVTHSPRSDTSSPVSTASTPPAHQKSHSSFSVDEILGKSPSSVARQPDGSSPAYVPSPAHETRWPGSLAVSTGFPWLPSSRISPPPRKYYFPMFISLLIFYISPPRFCITHVSGFTVKLRL